MQDEWDEIEAAARSALEQQDPWLNLLSASQRATDSWHFWTCAFEGAVQRRNAALADQIMRERVQPHEDYSAQPWLTTDHALMLEQLGRVEEALGAIRSALGDLPFDKALQEIEWRLLAKQTSSSRKG